MIQIDNINKIRQFREMFSELGEYDLDVSSYCTSFLECIEKYENSKKQSMQNGKDSLFLESNSEMQLSLDLAKLEFDLTSYRLFLDLMHATKTWDFNEGIDSVFELLHGVVDHKLLDKFYQISIQELILDKYYDLIFKKIVRDYQSHHLEYLEQYQKLEEYPYLKNSIQRFLESRNEDGSFLPSRLEDVVKSIGSKEENLPEVLEDTSKEITPVRSSFFTWIHKMCQLPSEKKRRDEATKTFLERVKAGCLDFEGENLSNVDFSNLCIASLNLKGSSAHINPQLVCDKNLQSCNLEDIDLEGMNFDDVIVKNAGFKNTNARIDPQFVFEKSFWGTNVEGLDFRGMSFEDVNVEFASFKNAKNLDIDPQLVRRRSLWDVNLEGVDMSDKEFKYTNLDGTNLKNTSAYIDLGELNYFNHKTCLDGCYVYGGGSRIRLCKRVNLENATVIDDYYEFLDRKEEAKREHDAKEKRISLVKV